MTVSVGISRRRVLIAALGGSAIGVLAGAGAVLGDGRTATNVARGTAGVNTDRIASAAAFGENGRSLPTQQALGTPQSHDMGSMATAAPLIPHKLYDARLPELLPLQPGTTNVRTLNLTVADATMEIAPNVRFAAWPYNGTVPAPVVHVRQGDTVKFTLTNKGTLPHSIDFHAAQSPPNEHYIDVKPGDSHSFDWTADYPGTFMYHCGSPLVLAHMATGMYGAVVVDPSTALPPAREYVLVQSEFYLKGQPGEVQTVDVTKALDIQPDYVVFNGYANQYKESPLTAKVGERVRFYIVNVGPSAFSSFHVIGTIFENAYADGNTANALHGMQSVTIPPGGGYMVECTVPKAGQYPFVTHRFADVNKGALGVLKITE